MIKMAHFQPLRAKQTNLEHIAIKDGQFIITDEGHMYIDFDDKRKMLIDPQALDELKTFLLTANNLFTYYIDDIVYAAPVKHGTLNSGVEIGGDWYDIVNAPHLWGNLYSFSYDYTTSPPQILLTHRETNNQYILIDTAGHIVNASNTILSNDHYKTQELLPN